MSCHKGPVFTSYATLLVQFGVFFTQQRLRTVSVASSFDNATPVTAVVLTLAEQTAREQGDVMAHFTWNAYSHHA